MSDDVARIAEGLKDDVLRAAIMNYPEQWSTDPLPRGWSGTVIGRAPLVDVNSRLGYARRLNMLGIAVREYLLNKDGDL